MSKLSVREQITAAICHELGHQHPHLAPGAYSGTTIPAEDCGLSGHLADVVLRVIVGKFRTDEDAPEGRWTHDWDQLQTAAMICLGIDDPEAYGGLPGHQVTSR